MYNIDDNNQSSNGGIYSKFQERLRKIKLSRLKKKRKNKEFIDDKVKEIREVIRNDKTPHYKVSIKGVNSLDDVVSNIRMTAKDRNYGNRIVGVDVEDDDKLEDTILNIKENKPKLGKKKVGYVSKNKNFTNMSRDERTTFLNDMGVDIIDKIRNSFEDKLDEIDVLESELFLLSLEIKSEVELKKAREVKNKINELIDKINVIIDQYNLYKKNYYIDNVIGIDDSIIVDDIINYRTLLDSFDDEKKFVKEYKALDEFKALYSSLVEVKEETERLQKDNEDKIVKFGIRDKKYNNIKLDMIKALDIDKKCSLEIDRQNEYFDRMMEKISKINREEYVTAHLRGLGGLLGNSLKYLGLLFVSPFTGMIPGITMQTIATRRMIANAYNHIHLEEVKHVRYSAINYDSELNHHLTDINYAEDLIDDALRDVDNLRKEFMYIYDSKVPGYEDTLKKINKIEKKLLHSQNKVSIVKKRLYANKKLNSDKLIRVRELNDKQNSA